MCVNTGIENPGLGIIYLLVYIATVKRSFTRILKPIQKYAKQYLCADTGKNLDTLKGQFFHTGKY